MVRLAAIKALGEIADRTTATDILLNCLGDETPVIRWAAQEVLEGANTGEASAPSSKNPPDSDDGEQLIQLL
jgi:HEAT repeat protein